MKQDEIYEKITETIITWLETSKDDVSWQKQFRLKSQRYFLFLYDNYVY